MNRTQTTINPEAIMRETSVVNARRQWPHGEILNAGPRPAKPKTRKPAPVWDFVAVSRTRAKRENETLSVAMAYIAAHSPTRHAEWLEKQRAAFVASEKQTSDKPAGGSMVELARQYASEHACGLGEAWRQIAHNYPTIHSQWVREGCE